MSVARATACALVACSALLACSSSPPTRYYTLKTIAPSGAAAVASTGSASNPVIVRLEPVAIPGELDRLELVRRTGPYRLQIADSERWAAPLDEQIRRILSADLAARLPQGMMADPNERATTEPRRLLSVTIAEFFADDQCSVNLRTDWTLRAPKGADEHGSEQVQSPESLPCAGVPAAMSAALATLADRLAAVIAAQPE